MTRRLLLLRHAKAEPVEYGTPDFDRPLIKRGRDAAKRIGRWMAAEGIVPGRVLCSPSMRTRETLERALKPLGAEPKTLFVDRLYNAAAPTFIDAIRTEGGKAKVLLVVGHNPSTEDAFARLAGSAGMAFPTGALAILEFDLADWSELAEGAGRLAAFVDPRSLPD